MNEHSKQQGHLVCASCKNFVSAYVMKRAKPVCLHCAGLAPPPDWKERRATVGAGTGSTAAPLNSMSTRLSCEAPPVQDDPVPPRRPNR